MSDEQASARARPGLSWVLHALGALALAAIVLVPLATTTHAQDKKEGLRSLVGKNVQAVLNGTNTVEVTFTIDALEAEGVWVSDLTFMSPVPAAKAAELNEYRYFFPWSSVGSIKLKKDKK